MLLILIASASRLSQHSASSLISAATLRRENGEVTPVQAVLTMTRGDAKLLSRYKLWLK